jgi:methylated-DNA-[protein]-cysteine S-methyltransferase
VGARLFETPLGTCGVAWSDAGLTCVQLPEADEATTRERLDERGGERARAAAGAPPTWVDDVVTRLQAHLGGEVRDFTTVPLDEACVTPWNAVVLRAAQAVPAGHTTTYGELAAAVGSPGASRAVGRAMATNPWPVVVPCHRVVAAARGTGGFSAHGGLVTKERLLRIEGGTLLTGAAARQTSLFAAQSTRALPFDADVAVRTLGAADPVLGRHIAAVGPLRLQLKDTEGTFAALAESIVYQQLSGRAAATIFGRVRALYPGGHLDPKRVLASRDEDLRGAGLSAAKLASLRDLAAKTLDGTVPALSALERLDDEAIIEALTAVRGVGRWTVEMLLVFRLGRPDVLPVADYGLKKAFARLFPKTGRVRYAPDELPTAEALVRRAERWRPFRSVASWYLWRALDTPG